MKGDRTILNSKEIIARIQENSDEIKRLKKESENLSESLRAFISENYSFRNRLDHRDKVKESDRKIGEIGSEINRLKIVNMILKDNARRAIYAEVMPAIVETICEYAGKPFGPKTEEKFSAAVLEKTGYRVYLELTAYSSGMINIYADMKGLFRYTDFRVIRKNGNDKLFDGNRLVSCSTEDFTLFNCGEYVENPEDQAEKIILAFDSLKKQSDEFEKACSRFNSMIPSEIQSVYSRNFRGYLLS